MNPEIHHTFGQLEKKRKTEIITMQSSTINGNVASIVKCVNTSMVVIALHLIYLLFLLLLLIYNNTKEKM